MRDEVTKTGGSYIMTRDIIYTFILCDQVEGSGNLRSDAVLFGD